MDVDFSNAFQWSSVGEEDLKPPEGIAGDARDC